MYCISFLFYLLALSAGNLVTPKTDPGDYVVEPNADLRLEAGQQIVLKPGVHIKNGAKAHLKIAYQECFETSGLQVNDPPQAIDGTIISRQTVLAGISEINTKQLARGVYIIIFKNQGQNFKLVKQ